MVKKGRFSFTLCFSVALGLQSPEIGPRGSDCRQALGSPKSNFNWQLPIANQQFFLRDRLVSAAQQVSKVRIGSEWFQMGIDAHECKADGVFSFRL